MVVMQRSLLRVGSLVVGGHRLHLLEGECAEVLEWLRLAALALPPSARRVGAFNVGHLPIVPSWD